MLDTKVAPTLSSEVLALIVGNQVTTKTFALATPLLRHIVVVGVVLEEKAEKEAKAEKVRTNNVEITDRRGRGRTNPSVTFATGRGMRRKDASLTLSRQSSRETLLL